ncbi:MAG: hypothetical protein B6D44_08710 [Ignavibacteriales bacterium UTCHB2]|jgi:signal transduction histidine kinase|nr:MAG: Alkaline phosphatase synthesis sensor protein PhoR [Ignavibacteria bacterium ADurb.Bin266]OQY72985.1 MAG: hypothetical protein B6D44_08710 [Ignavibacteriales bacterium UTCHB2]HQI40361.1 ATP-binding protein [Ignavibacteriaceae bacterium]HQJ46065.1 ATP-binding protein [Ignavibacteriaceae bacterium]
MKSALNKKSALLLIDIIIIIVCAGGFYLIIEKPNIPFGLNLVNDHLTITNFNEGKTEIEDGSILLSVDNYEFNDWEELELYLDGKRIGDIVNIKIKTADQIKSVPVSLINYYDLPTLIIIAIVALVFIGMAMFVRIVSWENYSAKLFHWASVGLGIIIVNTAGIYRTEIFSYGYINRLIWFFAYSFTPVLFIHFTSSFAKKKVRGIKYILWFFYLSALINALILSYLFLKTTLGGDLEYGRYYVLFFDSFFRLFLITCIIISITICIYAYKSTNDIEERKRLQWLLLGYFIGPLSFIIFWVVPIFLNEKGLLPESFILLLFTAIPITFSIAIVKYHLMDINLIIRRSVVYSIILIFIAAFYIGISTLVAFFIRGMNPAFPTIITAILVVFGLQPVKTKIQKFVDKKFFRVEYDFREEQKKFLDDIKASVDIQTLANKIVAQVNFLIPTDKIGFFILTHPNNKIKLIANQGWDLLKGRSLQFDTENLKTNFLFPVAITDKVESGIKIESADIRVFKRWGMILVFPVKSPAGGVLGFIALGSKKSGSRYFKDDIDLLNTVSNASALAIERIRFQEELILEKLEAERLEELNELKSFFMQTITHELKTPLSSIKMFAEKLRDHPLLTKEKSDLYLKVIDGESDKLKGLIDNILDYARIEKGMQTYHKSRIDLIPVVHKAVDSVQYQFMMKKQKIELIIINDTINICADETAVERAILNLLTNASKYSCEGSSTTISVSQENSYAIVQVTDEGCGISAESLKNIFEPFIRLEESLNRNIEGTGLGLAIVKHIMDRHDGRIEVKSDVGKGSCFSLFYKIEE